MHRPKRTEDDHPPEKFLNGIDRLRFWVACVIVVAWLSSLIAAATLNGFHIEPTVNIMAMGVAGWLFGPSFTGRRKEP